jgi:uncharacterized phage protein gp47/JayE
MAFVVPTLEELIDTVAGSLNASLDGQDARVRRSVLRALAVTQAGVARTLHQYVGHAARQVLPSTADGEALDAHAAIAGLTRWPAAQATGTTRASASSTGISIPTGTVLVRADGARFVTTADATTAGSPAVADLSVQAELAGAAGNCTASTILTLVSPISGVTSATTVQSPGVSGGTDQESHEALRARILQRLRNTPQGGSAADYEAWALAVAGVDKAWVRSPLAGFVTVYPAVAGNNPIPSGGLVSSVQAALDAKRPVAATVTAVAPTALTVNMTIAVYPNTTAVQSAVTAELQSLFARLREPGGTIRNSEVRAAISAADGEEYHSLNSIGGDGTGLSNIVQSSSQLAVLGTITWA